MRRAKCGGRLPARSQAQMSPGSSAGSKAQGWKGRKPGRERPQGGSSLYSFKSPWAPAMPIAASAGIRGPKIWERHILFHYLVISFFCFPLAFLSVFLKIQTQLSYAKGMQVKGLLDIKRENHISDHQIRFPPASEE